MAQQQTAAPTFEIFLRTRTAILISLAFLATVLTMVPAGQAQTFQLLHTFTGPDGAGPNGLIMDRGGRLYGGASGGGANNLGLVYRAMELGGWIVAPLHQFSPPLTNGDGPAAPVFGPDGNIYGVTGGGGDLAGNCVSDGEGCGVVFKLQPPAIACGSVLCAWNETVLYKFTGHPGDGDTPSSGVAFDAAGNLYGTTSYGGNGTCAQPPLPNYGCGIVYQLSHSAGGWTETVIYNFQGANDGHSPAGTLIVDRAGNLYGTAQGGSSGDGVVYELSPSNGAWTQTILHSFQGSDGSYPGALIADSSGNLYGITGLGGPQNVGTVFQLTQPGTWNFQTLYSFSSTANGTYPEGGLTRDSAGNFYGATQDGGTYNYGVAFKLTLSNGNWVESVLHSFDGAPDGFYPNVQIVDSAGNVYGTSATGGNTSDCYPAFGCGTLWRITP